MEGGERNFARIYDIGEVGNMGKVRSVMKNRQDNANRN